MRSTIKLALLLVVGLLAVSGCSAVRSLMSGDSGTVDSTAPEAVAEPSAPRFVFYDSWASW